MIRTAFENIHRSSMEISEEETIVVAWKDYVLHH
jgi:hypothetical protein